MKKIVCITLIVLFSAGAWLSFQQYRKSENNLKEILQNERDVIEARYEEDGQKAIETYKAALEVLGEDASIDIRILFQRWSEVEERYMELSRAIQWEKEEVVNLEKKMEEMKLLVKDLETKTKDLLASENLTPEEEWRLYNFMGCVKLYLTLFVEGKDEKVRKKRVQGLLGEAINSFKESINIIEENCLTGISTDIPRWNLELLLKRSESQGQSSGQPSEGEGGKQKQMKKVMPIIGSPGKSGGQK